MEKITTEERDTAIDLAVDVFKQMDVMREKLDAMGFDTDWLIKLIYDLRPKFEMPLTQMYKKSK